MARPEGRAGDRALSFGAKAEAALAGGAPGGAAVRWRGLASLKITARPRLGMGFAPPSGWASQTRPGKARFIRPDRKGRSSGLASRWRLPALHFFSGTRATRALT
jgi:hypothetical protein